jgi:hypothetical protein
MTRSSQQHRSRESSQRREQSHSQRSSAEGNQRSSEYAMPSTYHSRSSNRGDYIIQGDRSRSQETPEFGQSYRFGGSSSGSGSRGRRR